MWASTRCIGAERPRAVANTEVRGDAEDMRGYHAYDAEEDEGGGPP